MRLLKQFSRLLTQSHANTFAQKRSQTRATEMALGTLCALGRRTVSRSICAVGRQHQDWSADYKLYSRSPWKENDLFDPILTEYFDRYREGDIVMAGDDTKLARTGRKIPNASWHRDPMSPPFHTNLLYGLRFLQLSLIFPHYREGSYGSRAIPVRFVECPPVKKPGKRASEEERAAYRQARKKQNLSQQGLAVVREVRTRLDQLGAANRTLLSVWDGSFCNQTFFKANLDRIELIARCRKDARLCFRAPEGSRRFYDEPRFTPEQIRQDDERYPWKEARVCYGSDWRVIRYKEVKNVRWQRGAGKRPLRVLVLAPIPYRVTPQGKTLYREPAYLLTTDLTRDALPLIQAYLDRWQIEVNHRDEKDTLGVGQAQVWSAKSVSRQPAFAVSCYSLLLLAALLEFGPGRTDDYLPLPKWRKMAKRASILDMISLLRMEIEETAGFDGLEQKINQNLVAYAYT